MSIAGPSRLITSIRAAPCRSTIQHTARSSPIVLIRQRRPLSTSPRSYHASPSTSAKTPSSSFSTVNADEISHFASLSSEWWNESGEFGLLHRMNPARVEYVRRVLASSEAAEEEWTFANRHEALSREQSRGTGLWLARKRVLDVGCGGGLLSESLARVGGDVLGIDASEVNVGVASVHAAQDPFLPFGSGKGVGNGRGRLEYRHTSAEKLRDEGEKFDLVCSMEVLEHVDEPGEFLKCLGDMVKPGGHLVLSTIARTPLSRLLTITLAESVLHLVTPGTHTYEKFVNPTELRRFVYSDMGGYDVWERNADASDVRDGEVGSTQGIVYDPLSGGWRLWDGVEGTWGKGLGEGCNYMYHVRKRPDAQQ